VSYENTPLAVPGLAVKSDVIGDAHPGATSTSSSMDESRILMTLLPPFPAIEFNACFLIRIEPQPSNLGAIHTLCLMMWVDFLKLAITTAMREA
jgi:hypothetical protein